MALTADHLQQDIVASGVLTTKGRVRSAVMLYLQVLDRQARLAAMLGLERRAKRVPTLRETIATIEDRARTGWAV